MPPSALPILFTLIGLSRAQLPCQSRDYGNGGTVCVCNTTYCDMLPRPEVQPNGQLLIYTSNRAGLRFAQSNATFQARNLAQSQIVIDAALEYQGILGFGGAFTDATGINLDLLEPDLQDVVLNSYFSEEGIEYSMGRVPIGGTDFSTRAYSYDDGREDLMLQNFQLQPEDYELKIPLIRRVANITNLRLLCSAWTAPKWMKTNGQYNGFGFLRRDMYQTWAEYYLRFLDAYQEEGIDFWGMTTGNEPADVMYPSEELEVVGWPSWLLDLWIRENLGPTIRNSAHANITIMMLDDQRLYLPWYIQRTLSNPTSRGYVDGIAVHWYYDQFVPASVLSRTQRLFPEKFILATEASIVPEGGEPAVMLGSWYRGERYSADIMEDLQNWVTGWLDWNLMLNPQGGPNYISNFVDSPIIVNGSAQEFYKQPMFYHLGHFSKFVQPGSVRILSETRPPDVGVGVVAFLRPDGGTAVVVLNRNDRTVAVNLTDNARGTVGLQFSPRSITTILYW